jgi:hypothetical protein
LGKARGFDSRMIALSLCLSALALERPSQGMSAACARVRKKKHRLQKCNRAQLCASEQCGGWSYFQNRIRVCFTISRVPFNSINRLINIELEIGFWRRISGLFMEVLGLFFSFLFYFMKMFNIKLICN